MNNLMAKKMTKIFVITILSFFSVFSQAKPEILDRVVAMVDTDVVLASELLRRTKSIIGQIKSRGQQVPPLDLLGQQILDKLIMESLQLQIAKRVGVRISDSELDAAIDQMSKENNISVAELMAKSLAEGVSWAIYREDIRNEIMISRVRGGYVSRRIQISDKEVDNLLVQINQEGESQIQYSIGHILLTIAETASPEEIEKVREQANKLIGELRDGANFEQYAISYSAGQNALNGGNLGSRSLAQLPTLFADNVKNMKVGDVSEALRSGSGLHILKVIDIQGGFETLSVMQTHARHILITPNVILDEDAAFKKLQTIRQRIVDGEKFEELAMLFSDDKGSGALGGDLDWTDPGTFVPEFTKAMDSLAIGEMSQPIKTQFGWHMIEVLGRRDQDQTEDKKRERAYRILQNRKFEEEAQIWLSEIKEQAYIKIIDEK